MSAKGFRLSLGALEMVWVDVEWPSLKLFLESYCEGPTALGSFRVMMNQVCLACISVETRFRVQMKEAARSTSTSINLLRSPSYAPLHLLNIQTIRIYLI